MKYIGSFGLALLVALMGYFFLEPVIHAESAIQLRIRATVPQDDFFQVFFQHDTSVAFSEKLSLRQTVRGGDQPQWVLLEIPYDQPITKLRIDVGQNEDQGRLEIYKIRLSPSLRDSDTLSIKNDFQRNEFLVPMGKGVYQLQSWNGEYDPQFISTFEVSEYLCPRNVNTEKNTQIPLALWGAVLLGVLAFWRSLYVSWDRWSKLQIAFATLVLLVILVPVAVVSLDIEPTVNVSENRTLEERPAFFWHTDFTKSFDRYYQDRFGLRSWMVQRAGIWKTKLFRVSPRPEEAQIGHNGFLFFNSRSEFIFDSFSHQDRATPLELNIFFEREKYLADHLADQGIKYIRTFWPNKHTIYPEYLPLSLRSAIQPGPSLVDQACQRLAKEGMELVDVRPHLLRKKKDLQLYRKLDTHWNYHGGYEAYVAFCMLTQKELGVNPFPRSSFNISYHESGQGDLLTIMGVDSLPGFVDSVPLYQAKPELPSFREIKDPAGFPGSTTITMCDKAGDGRTVIVFHDSYIGMVKPFLSRHFRKVVYIWDTLVDVDLVDQEQPDVVISAPLERFYGRLVR